MTRLMQEFSAIIQPESWTRQLDLASLFSEKRPLEADIGCGKGRFLLARARNNPGINYIGIERLLLRLRKVDKRLVREGLTNVRLLRIEASYAVQHMLPPLCLSAAYVFFPDPWPKRKHHRRRLFTSAFVDSLHRVLLPGATVHAATDHGEYFEQIERLLKSDSRFEEISPMVTTPEEQTDFEIAGMAQLSPIGRCSFRKK